MKRITVIVLLLLPFTICSCKGHREYSGFTWISKGPTGDQYIEVNSISTADYVPLTFHFLIENKKEKLYSIVSIETDCQRLFIDDGGTSYSVDGRMVGEVLPDEASGDIDKKGMRTIISRACANSVLRNTPQTSTQPKSSEIGQGFDGDWDDEKAMAAFYGNYDFGNNASQMKFDRALGNFGDIFQDGAGLWVRLLTVKQLGEKRMLFTEATPDKESGIWTCRSCSPMIGAAVFIPKNGGWVIEAAGKYIAIGAEGNGVVPDPSEFVPVNFGPSKSGFVWTDSWFDLRDESSGAYGSFVANIGTRLVAVFETQLSVACGPANNQDSSDSSNDDCRKVTTAYQFVPGSNVDYYDLRVTVTTDVDAGHNKVRRSQTRVLTLSGDKFLFPFPST
jgi:hypothetical protein